MARTRNSSGVSVWRPPAQQAPIIRVSAPRVVAAPKAKRRSRPRHGGGGGGGGGGTKQLMGVVVGAGIVGVLKKSGMMSQIPSIPVVGRIGAIAIAAHFWAQNGGGQLARDISLAAASIAAFQFGSEGEITGEDDSM